jgi:hypothetical protein
MFERGAEEGGQDLQFDEELSKSEHEQTSRRILPSVHRPMEGAVATLFTATVCYDLRNLELLFNSKMSILIISPCI